MYLLLLYCVLILCLYVLLYFYWKREDKGEVEYFDEDKIVWGVDEEALKEYCVAKKVDVGDYKRGIVTD
jgi:hypothetical protein